MYFNTRCFSWLLAIVSLVTAPWMPVAIAGETKYVVADQENQQTIVQMFDTRYSEEAYYRTDRVLLTATKHLIESRKAPAINTVITAKEIRNMGARNLCDVLDKIPGISTPWNQIKELIDIRGVHTEHSEKVLLMIDGVRIKDSYVGSPTYLFGEDMMVENIERIEVVRGPGSALYGANAFIGVINVITKTPEDYGETHVTLSTSMGSFNTKAHTLLFAKNSCQIKVSGHVNYLDTDGERPTIKEDALSNHSQFNTSASLAPGEALTSDEKLDCGVKLSMNDLMVTGRYIDKTKGGYVGPLGVLSHDVNVDTSMGLFDIDYNGQIIDDLSLTAKGYCLHIDYEAYVALYPSGFHPVIDDKGMIGRPMFKNNVIGTELSATYTMGDHLITSGLVHEYDRQYDVRQFDNFSAYTFGDIVETTDTNNFNKNVTRKIWAAFFQEMWEITAYDSLTLGVRYDHYSNVGGTTNPRAGYVHEFKNETTFKLLYGRAFRAPTNNELYSVNNPVVQGNSDLDPETIESLEASLEIPFFTYYAMTVSYFHNEIDDIIRWDKRVPPPSRIMNVKGESVIDGVETELTFNFGRNRYGYLNVSYQSSEDSEKRTLPYVAHWMGNMGYNHEFFGMLNTHVNVYWMGERTRREEDTRDKAPSAILVDLALILRNVYKTLEIKGAVFNLVDENYVDPSTIEEVTHDLPHHVRMFLAEVRYSF